MLCASRAIEVDPKKKKTATEVLLPSFSKLLWTAPVSSIQPHLCSLAALQSLLTAMSFSVEGTGEHCTVGSLFVGLGQASARVVVPDGVSNFHLFHPSTPEKNRRLKERRERKRRKRRE